MYAAAEQEFTGPVGYDLTWAVLVGAALLLVIGYYAAVLWWTRARPGDVTDRPGHGPGALLLAEVAAVEAGFRQGSIDTRAAHLRLSTAVREYAAARTGLPVATMALADIRAAGHRLQPVAEAVAVMYPPEFSGVGEQPDAAAARLHDAAARCRALAGAWG